MKTIRSVTASLFALALVLCLLLGVATPAYAAEPDMDNYLAKALGITQAELNNYAANYSASLPLTYEKKSTSYYVALGGAPAYGYGANSFSSSYTELLKNAYGFTDDTHENQAFMNELLAKDVVGYINGRNVTKAIGKADLITFQLDGSSLMTSAKETIMNLASSDNKELNWSKYVSGSVLTDFSGFRAKVTNEYAAEYGSNAELIAMALECMLYECVVYANETMNGIQAIRNHNSKAVILVLGLYNPIRNLTLSTNGKDIAIGAMVDSMIDVYNAYLLKQTKNMANVAFVDVSDASTIGFGKLESDINDLVSDLANVLGDTAKQLPNQNGHDYIAEQVKNALKAPCKHTNTTTVNKKDATCTTKGYTGDTKCTECNTILKTGTETDKVAHQYGAWTQTKAPTCTEKGSQVRSCTKCTHQETQAINPKNHTWDNGTVIKQADCKNPGSMKYSCTACTATKTEAIPTIAHTWDQGTVTKEPTCKEEGVKTLTCTVCSSTTTEAVPTISHAWDNGTETKHPTCNVEGEKTFTCTTCTETKTEAIPTTTHQFGEYVSNNDATCLQDGTKTATCPDCGTEDTVTDPNTKLEHTYTDGACSNCGAADPDAPTEAPDNIGIVILIVCIAIVAAGGIGFLVFWFVKKKNVK